MKLNKKPFIGISLDFIERNNDRYKYSLFPWYALRQNYADSVMHAGGVPVMIPYQFDNIDNILEVIDGLIIPGGYEDINPKFYNQEIISNKITTNDTRASFEFALLKKALEINMPFLGICNGMQLLNILLGGDLIQDIQDHFCNEGVINHEQPHPKHIPSHNIIIKSGTILSKIAGGLPETIVNSTHHQAIGNIGEGLIVSAYAEDGIVEAIESLNHKFVIGVEWHPEYLNRNNIDLALFQALVTASTIK
jgi:putative glutamine amidotransferase